MFSLKKTAALALTVVALFTMVPFKTLAASANGWNKDGAYWYYYENGTRKTGWLKDGGKWYYLNKNGVMNQDIFLVEIDSKKYSFDSSGAMRSKQIVKYSIGKEQDGKEYFLHAYVKADGSAVTGWKKISGKWYYFNPDCTTNPLGYFVVDGNKYINSNKGYIVQNGWGYVPFKLPDGSFTYYYAGPDGELCEGWKKVSGKWYYLKPYMLRGLFGDNGKVYYLDKSGAMKTGWVDVDGRWYYFDKSGEGHNGWVGKKEYYCTQGLMIRDGYFEVEGVMYYFDKDGHPSLASGK